MAEFLKALSDTLAFHRKALDLRNTNSRREDDAYASLAGAFAELAARLSSTAREMAGYRDLSMGAHLEHVLNDPKLVDEFARFVRIEEELLKTLTNDAKRDREMLDSMR